MQYIGYSIWYGSGNLLDYIEYCYDVGFNLIEVSLDYPWPESFYVEYPSLKETLEKYGLKLGVHVPWRDIHLASPRWEICEASIKTILRLVKEICSLGLEPEYVCVHIDTREKVLFEEVYSKAFRNALKAVRVLEEEMKNIGVKLVVENTFSILRDSTDILDFIRHLGYELNICLDIGHLAYYYLKICKVSLDELTGNIIEDLDRLRRLVKVVHIHDVIVDQHGILDHVALTKGVLNWDTIIPKLHETKARYLVLETAYSSRDRDITHEDLKSSLSLVRKYLSGAELGRKPKDSKCKGKRDN